MTAAMDGHDGCGLYRTRTCNLLDVNEALCQLS